MEKFTFTCVNDQYFAIFFEKRALFMHYLLY